MLIVKKTWLTVYLAKGMAKAIEQVQTFI